MISTPNAGRVRSARVMALAVIAALFAGAAPATAAPKVENFVRLPGVTMTPELKARLVPVARRIETICRSQARSAGERNACRRGKFPRRGKRQAAVQPGFAQFEFVCHRSTGFIPTWSALPISQAAAHIGLTNPPANHNRDYVLYPQFPIGTSSGTAQTLTTALCNAVALTIVRSTTANAPTAMDLCETANDTYTVPDVKPGQAYFVNGVLRAPGDYSGTGTVTVVARATAPFYTVVGQTTWTFAFTDVPCPKPAVPVPPTATGVCGPDNDTVTTFAVTGIEYATGQWSGNSRTVTASALPGFFIPDGAATTWRLTDENVPCPIPVVPTAPVVQTFCGPQNDIVTLPTVVGLRYTATDWANGSLTVSATALPGYVVPSGSPLSWRVTDGATPCPPDPLVEPPLAPTTLSIRKTVRKRGNADVPVKFGIVVRNTGRVTARNVVLTDRVPSGLALVRRPVDGTISKGVIRWEIGDLQPGSFIFLSATMRLTGNRTARRCNNAVVAADNAPAMRASACTSFIRVAGAQAVGVTG